MKPLNNNRSTESKNRSRSVEAAKSRNSHTQSNNPPANTTIQTDETSQENLRNNLARHLDTKLVDLKLQKKITNNQDNQQKLKNTIKKLDLDLIKAKIELIQDDQNNYTKTIDKPAQNQKISMTNSYSSGIVITTSNTSSSSSSASTSPPLQVQEPIKVTPLPEIDDDSDNRKNIQFLLVNKPRRLPCRRHTYASKSERLSMLPTGLVLSSSSECSINNTTDDDEIKCVNKTRKRRVISMNNADFLFKSSERFRWGFNNDNNHDNTENYNRNVGDNNILLNLSPLSMSASSVSSNDSVVWATCENETAIGDSKLESLI